MNLADFRKKNAVDAVRPIPGMEALDPEPSPTPRHRSAEDADEADAKRRAEARIIVDSTTAPVKTPPTSVLAERIAKDRAGRHGKARYKVIEPSDPSRKRDATLLFGKYKGMNVSAIAAETEGRGYLAWLRGQVEDKLVRPDGIPRELIDIVVEYIR